MIDTLAIQRGLTEAFIARDPVDVVFIRTTGSDDDAGGWIAGTAIPLPAQTLTFVPSNNQLPQRMTVDGQSASPEGTLVGVYDADVVRGDIFSIEGGGVQEIVYVYADRRYRTTAEVVARG